MKISGLEVNFPGRQAMVHFPTGIPRFKMFTIILKIRNNTTKNEPSGKNTWNFLINTVCHMSSGFYLTGSREKYGSVRIGLFVMIADYDYCIHRPGGITDFRDWITCYNCLMI